MKKSKLSLSILIWAGNVVLWTCCLPCYLLYLCNRKSRRSGRDSHKTQPQSLLPRKRALTLPLEDDDTSQTTFEQPQSALIFKLPLELRRKVYEQALGYSSIHLQIRYTKLTGRRCGLQFCHHDRFYTGNELKVDIPVALLRTCRLIYSEAIEFLYSHNHFSITSLYQDYFVLPYLPQLVIPQRLCKLRTLHIYWDMFPHFDLRRGSPVSKEWFGSWEALEQMTGLRDLFIEISLSHFSTHHHQIWLDREIEMFTPVKNITAPKTFVIILPDRRCSTRLDVGTTNCCFRLPDEPADHDLSHN